MSAASTVGLGDALLGAYASREPIAPLTATNPDLSVEDAYAVQLHQVAAWKAAGRTVVGYKVGLTSQAMQQQLGVDQPDFGHLFDDMVLDASAPINLDGHIAPRIEPEISFVLKKDLRGPGLTAQDVTDAVGHAVISLEIIDSRIADWKITLADTIADNASSGALVLGDRKIALDDVDLAAAPVTLSRNGEVVGTGLGSAVLGHPIEGAVWLANTLGALGQTLEAGSIIMAGSITAAVAIAPGDTVTADFGELGALTIEFAG
ncbi:2-keto-4-pentenoate hydratase [Homoserinimonas aerilata]|uniref:2-keto-4-pentenoate hydratase n=1 Tax=Homoserinimonas aerilata TaxID=1162970 RepID=A0A542YG88_9MICO|nr:fumarylacetoacetate hydrolase family protein [Homoserinimonas aerilata]TQL47108.1 2-keto-4-pentenoate hydratase [Homoserinimonas aerilata]